MEGILDRANYVIYAEFSSEYFSLYLSEGYASLFFNEPLWLSINIFLRLFLDNRETLSVIIFAMSFVSAYLILKADKKNLLFLLLLLFFPQVLGKYIVHLRQGLALTFFLIGWFSFNTKLRWLFFLMTPFIHSSFFFIIFIYLFVRFLIIIKLRFIFKVAAMFVFSLTLALTMRFFAVLFGARQGELYNFKMTDVSGFGFIFWFGVLVLYCLQGRKFREDNLFLISSIVFYLSTYFLIDVAARVFENTIIIIIIAGLNLTFWRKKYFIACCSLYFILSWYISINLPFFGWGLVNN